MNRDWQQITEDHGPIAWAAIFRVLRSHAESLDCFQDVMLEAFQHSRHETISNWPGFLRWLAVRRALDRLRKRRRKSELIDDDHDVRFVVCSPNDVGTSLELEELKARLRSELGNLPERQAEAFWLRFIEQMTYSEIASQMNIETNAVGVLVHRARERVCESLSDLKSSNR